MEHPDPQVLLCGYYGEHNLGDDVLLQVLLQQLPVGCEALATARDEREVRERFGVATTDRTRLAGVLAALGTCRALVLGGGSLLQDATSFRSLLYYAALILAARLQGKSVILWGQGLGPLRRRRSRLLVRALLPLVTAISWRDPASARLGQSLGGKGLLGSDPVWAWPAAPWHGAGGPILLCWRPVKTLEADGWRALLHALDALATAADRPVHWLPFHREQDHDLLERLAGEGLVPPRLRTRSRPVEAMEPAEAMAHFQAAGLVLAMRLHGLILAALAGAPLAALSYDPKVQAAATAIGCPCLDLSAPPSPAQLGRWREMLDRPTEAGRIRLLQEQAAVHRRVLEPLAGCG
ncbi:MAG: polysaccharide pyruvyl transferase CsaB [Synechococcaceae cyanobacterium]|nr:polysaccharide pyruvyl transferase CsaB [Synechococcaceae cyanobacterium]